MSEPKILLEEVNPNGNLEAIVEDDGRTAYLYVNAEPSLQRPMRAVWLRNSGPAPQQVDTAGMQDGRAPQLPATACRFPMGGQPSLDPARLSVSWTEDGEGLFLLEDDELLAVVPAWTTLAESGWSRDCTADTPFALALKPERLADAKARLQRAENFWKTWSGTDTWTAIRTGQLAAYTAGLGKLRNALMLGDQRWPPLGLGAFMLDDAAVTVTIGMGLRAQPGVDRDARELAPRLRRVELGFAANATLAPEVLQKMSEFVGGQAGYPWARFAWVGNGHTLSCDFLPRGKATFPAIILLAAPTGAPKLALPAIDGEPVTLLWVVPITDAERLFARQHGSAKLVEKLAAAGVGWAFSDRTEVPLG